jgi:hypothetical protein
MSRYKHMPPRPIGPPPAPPRADDAAWAPLLRAPLTEGPPEAGATLQPPPAEPATLHSILGAVLALVIGILGTLALIHWMSCSQEAGTALCMAMAVTPTRSHWLARTWTWLQVLRLRLALRNEREALAAMQEVADEMPLMLSLQRNRVDYWRSRLSQATGTPTEQL